MRVLLIALLAAISYAQTEEPEDISFSFNHPMIEGRNGFVATEIFTTGEVIETPSGDFYRPPGVLDGLGAKLLDENTVRLFANHELSAFSGGEYTLANGLTITGARVSFYDIDKSSMQILDAGLAYDTIYDYMGNEVTDNLQLHEDMERSYEGKNREQAGLAYLCSANFVSAGTYGFEDDIFFTGEERTYPYDRLGGVQYALDTQNRDLWAMPAVGRGSWEASIPLVTDDENTIGLLFGNDQNNSPLKIYIGQKEENGGFLARNGLLNGDVYIFKADDPSYTSNDQFHGTGTSIDGRFVRIDVHTDDPELVGTHDFESGMGYNDAGYASNNQIDANLQAVGGFTFGGRIEDVGTYKDLPNQAIFQATGKSGNADLWGTTYHVEISFPELTATIRIIYDANDAGNGKFEHPDYGLRNGDNLEWFNPDWAVIQEDLPDGEGGTVSKMESSIWEIEIETGLLYRIAEVNRQIIPQTYSDGCTERVGCWESSGIIDVSDLFDIPGDEVLFLLDLQAHELVGPEITKHDLKESSQLIFLRGPATLAAEPTCEDDDATVSGFYGAGCAAMASYQLCHQPMPNGEGTIEDFCGCSCGDGSSDAESSEDESAEDESEDDNALETTETPEACCAAMYADCLACSANMSVEDYCAMYPETSGCDAPVDTDAPEDTDAPVLGDCVDNDAGLSSVFGSSTTCAQMAQWGLCEQPLNADEKVKDVCALSCGNCEGNVDVCLPVVCGCALGLTTVEEVDETGCVTSCACVADETTVSAGNALGETCGYVFGLGNVGGCSEGLVCACVGPCADPMIADYPSTCVEEGYTTAGPSCADMVCICPTGQDIVEIRDANGCVSGCDCVDSPVIERCPGYECNCPTGYDAVPITGADGCVSCDCVESSSDSGDYTCGSTMEECQAAYEAAMKPAVEVMIPTMTYDSCESADGWWVSGTLNGLAGYDAETMSVCVSDGQYMVEVDGKVYATCVAYGTPNQDTCTDDSLICPSLPNDPNTFGWGGNQRSVLAAALSRADFKHPECPTSTCMSMDSLADSGSYWKDQVLSNPYTVVTEAAVDNVCVTPDNEVMMITREGMCNTCLGWSSVATDICDTQKFICAGHSGQGEFTYGWPGQIARTLAVAVANEEGNYMHPQCPVNICSA